MPCASGSGRMSFITTGTPASWARSCAIPPPMVPAPRTAASCTGRASPPLAPTSFLAPSVSLKTCRSDFETPDVASSPKARDSAAKPAAGPSSSPVRTTSRAASGAGYLPCVRSSVFLRAWSKTSLRPSGFFSSSSSLRSKPPPPCHSDRVRPRCACAKSRTWWRKPAAGSRASAKPWRSARLRRGRAPAEDPVEGVGQRQQPRQPGAAAPGRQDAQADLRQADAHLGPVGHQAVGRGQGELGAAAEAGTVDRGHGGEGSSDQSAKMRWPAREPSVGRGGVGEVLRSGPRRRRRRSRAACRRAAPGTRCRGVRRARPTTSPSSRRTASSKTLSLRPGASKTRVANPSEPAVRRNAEDTGILLRSRIRQAPTVSARDRSAPEYSASMVCAYLSWTIRRLIFWVGVSSPPSRVNSAGRSSQATIFS